MSERDIPMPAFTLETRPDGIAVLTFDLQDKKVNVLTSPVMNELDKLLDGLALRKDVKALVVRSGKEGQFIAGADVAEIRDVTDAQKGYELSRKGQAVRELERLLPDRCRHQRPLPDGGLGSSACSPSHQRCQKSRPQRAKVQLIIPGSAAPSDSRARRPRERLTRSSRASRSMRRRRRIGLVDEATFREMVLDRHGDYKRRSADRDRKSARPQAS
jgi:hypothetical protein